MSQPHTAAAATIARGRQPISTGVIAHLNREWAALTTLNPGTDTVQNWATAHPALSVAATLDELVRHVTSHVSGTNDDQVAALIDLTQHGDQLAQRTLIQSLLGCATRLAARTIGHADSLETARCQALSALCHAIHAYNLSTRTRNHVSGLALDTLRGMTLKPREVEQIPAGLTPLEDDIDDEAIPGQLPFIPAQRNRTRHDISTNADDDARTTWWATHPGEASIASEGELAQLLHWATTNGVITTTNAAILRLMYGRDRATSAHIAADFGLCPSAIRERARTATRQLRRAVQAGYTPSLRQLGDVEPIRHDQTQRQPSTHRAA